MEQETKVTIEQAMELADAFEQGYDAGVYNTKFKILRWAMEHKKAIETNGDEDDAFERGEYSILNVLIDKINQVQNKRLTTAHQLVCVYSSPLWPDDVLGDLWDYADSLLQNTELSDFRREQLMKERCEEIRMQRNKKQKAKENN